MPNPNEPCISCGKPLSDNESRNYCEFCTSSDGTMKSYDEVLAGMVGFLTSSQNMKKVDAQKAAKNALSKLPAWRN